MGVSIQQRCLIHFNNEDDCNLFNNYLERLIVDHYLTRTSGFDVDNYSVSFTDSNKPEYYFSELFSHGYHMDNIYLEFEMDIDNNTVEIDTCGYGTIPEFIIGYALEQYKADAFYLKQSACQGQQDTNAILSYNKNYNQSEFVVIPNFVNMFDW